MPAALAAALEARTEPPRITRENGSSYIVYGHDSGHALLPSMVDVDAQLSEMAAAGIDEAVLSVNVPGVDWFDAADGAAVARDVNDELIALGEEHPGRLAAIALLPMQDPAAAATELARAVAGGLKGAIVYSNVAGRDLDQADCREVLDAAAELGVPIMIHPTFPLSAPVTDAYAMISTLGFLVDTSMAAVRLIFGGLYERHPEFKLYLCHAGSLLPQLAGRADYECTRFDGATGRLEALPSERISQLYTDTVCAWPAALRSALELVGPERMMFGSDYPFWDARATVDTVAGAGLPAEERSSINYGNAARVFALEG
jgi:aminocarboxymuconate-semialdehyde decarboxylase